MPEYESSDILLNDNDPDQSNFCLEEEMKDSPKKEDPLSVSKHPFSLRIHLDAKPVLPHYGDQAHPAKSDPQRAQDASLKRVAGKGRENQDR